MERFYFPNLLFKFTTAERSWCIRISSWDESLVSFKNIGRAPLIGCKDKILFTYDCCTISCRDGRDGGVGLLELIGIALAGCRDVVGMESLTFGSNGIC